MQDAKMEESLKDVKMETKINSHQSLLAPSENKFHVGNGENGKHYWLTPPELYSELDKEFHFNFDPCPYPLPDGFDGLITSWASSNYVNPPFGSIIHDGKKKGPTAWVRKAIAEHEQGKRVVLVYPVDKWLLMLLKSGAKVRNLGDVKWLATEDQSQGKGTGRHIACFILDHFGVGKVDLDRLADETAGIASDYPTLNRMKTAILSALHIAFEAGKNA